MPDSPYPIYMWFDNGTIYWWSEDNTPSLNPSSGSMFNKFSNLNDISGVKNWDTTEVTNIDFMFNITSITDLTNLSKWNTSNITGMSGVFGQNTHLQSLSGIENWDTSNVTNIGYLLYESPNIESIDEIKNWDTSKVTNMVYLFYKNSVLTSIDGLDNWDTSNLKQMQGMFGDMANVEEIDISNFDTRNVTNFKKIFDGSKKLKHIYVGENWDTSSNTNESTYVFPVTSELPNFSTSNENYRDLVWAHYGEGGYLTLKTNEGGN
jgi:surface protein